MLGFIREMIKNSVDMSNFIDIVDEKMLTTTMAFERYENYEFVFSNSQLNIECRFEPGEATIESTGSIDSIFDSGVNNMKIWVNEELVLEWI